MKNHTPKSERGIYISQLVSDEKIRLLTRSSPHKRSAPISTHDLEEELNTMRKQFEIEKLVLNDRLVRLESENRML